MSQPQVAQRFGPTSGTFSGLAGLIGCGVVLVVAVSDGPSVTAVRLGVGDLLVAVLLWAFMLRPKVVLESDSVLVLRNPLSDWRIPLASVTRVDVRTVTMVFTDERRYVGVGVGRSVRAIVRRATPGHPEPGGGSLRPTTKITAGTLPDFVIDRIQHAADIARETGQPTGPGERVPAWVLIAAAGVLAVALVVLLLL